MKNEEKQSKKLPKYTLGTAQHTFQLSYTRTKTYNQFELTNQKYFL